MKKVKVITGLFLAAILVAITSCGGPVSNESVGEEGDAAVEGSGAGGVDYSYPSSGTTGKSGGTQGIPEPAVISDNSWSGDRMIVRTGQMAMVVIDVSVAIDQITTLADSSDGYVVSSNVWKSGERLVGSISIRIPAGDFNNAMETLRNLAVEVTSETTSSSDVTEEYVDLTSKLDNLEATEAQLLTILEKAETVEDILDVQAQLSKVRGDIEQTKGRIQYLERTSATSLITIQLQESSLSIEFTADKRRVKEGEKIQFTLKQVSGGFPPYSYEWDFGDGDTSTEENPSHSYTDDGSYTVTLTVTDQEDNTDTMTKQNYIIVTAGWSAGKIASSAWNGMVAFFQGLANFFIWLGVFLPLWIIIAAIVIGVLYLRRRIKKRNADKENP